MSTASSRQLIAERLADFCIKGNLNDCYGVNVTRVAPDKGKTHWSVLFCKARRLDGCIRIYGERFILVKWQGMGTREGSQICTSENEAKLFLTGFINPAS